MNNSSILLHMKVLLQTSTL